MSRKADAALHVRIYDKYLFQLPAVKAVQKQGADFPGPLHGGVLGGIEEAVLYGDAALHEEPAPIFPHHKKLCVGVLLQKALGLPDGVLVVSPSKALIRRNDKAAIGAL